MYTAIESAPRDLFHVDATRSTTSVPQISQRPCVHVRVARRTACWSVNYD